MFAGILVDDLLNGDDVAKLTEVLAKVLVTDLQTQPARLRGLSCIKAMIYETTENPAANLLGLP